MRFQVGQQVIVAANEHGREAFCGRVVMDFGGKALVLVRRFDGDREYAVKRAEVSDFTMPKRDAVSVLVLDSDQAAVSRIERSRMGREE